MIYIFFYHRGALFYFFVTDIAPSVLVFTNERQTTKKFIKNKCGVVVVVVVVVGIEEVADRTLFDESVKMTFIAVPTTDSEAPSMSLLEAVLAWSRIAFPALLMKEETLFCLKKKHQI